VREAVTTCKVDGGRQTFFLIAKQLGWGHRPQEEIGHTAVLAT